MKTDYSLISAVLATLLGLLTTLPANGQEPLLPPAEEMAAESPAGEDLPPVESIDEPAAAAAPDAPSSPTTDEGEEVIGELGDVATGLDPFYAGTERIIDACPALFESSGTWLRRGYWYSEVDVVLLNRRFAAKPILIGREIGAVASSLGTVRLFSNALTVRNDPGAEILPRLTLGRFLFRDEENRDHVAEFTWFGAADFKQNASLQAASTQGISVPSIVDQSDNLGLPGEIAAQTNAGASIASNISFDGAQSMAFTQNGQFDSFESSYLVKGRLDSDQMILRPDGEWVRRAHATRTKSFLAGLRYINLNDTFDWTATGIPTTTARTARGNGTYHSKADNDLIGTQFGFGFNAERDRWSFNTLAKAGGYYNRMHLITNFDVLDNTSAVRNSGRVNLESNNLSFVGELSALAKWHLRPNFSLRAGANLIFVNSLALTVDNLSFQPGGYQNINHSSDNVLLGTSIGFEGYW